MSKQRQCIRITSTRTGKLRARVEIAPKVGSHEVGLGSPGIERFEITLGGTRWDGLNIELQAAIYNHAQGYVHHLMDELSRLRTKRALQALRPLRYGSAYEEGTS